MPRRLQLGRTKMDLRCSLCDAGRLKSYAQLNKHWTEANHPGKPRRLPSGSVISEVNEEYRIIPPKRARKQRVTKAAKQLEKIDKLIPVPKPQPQPKLKITPRRSDVSLRLESANSTSVPTSPNLKMKDFLEFKAYQKKTKELNSSKE